jgi:DNA processing protein
LRNRRSTAYNQDNEVGCTAGDAAVRAPASCVLCPFDARQLIARVARRPGEESPVTLDEAVAISLLPDLPRVGLGDRLRCDDPELREHASRGLEAARRARERAAAAGIHVLPWNAPRFPAALLAISDPPPVLWYRGSIEVLDAAAVAIVGSRAASAVALETARRLAADVAEAGVVVVSGLARGVDAAAHRGALQRGRTIAVLGSGVDRVYPHEHTSLASEIAELGLVASEYPPGTPPLGFHFPQRNRLISGLSRAVVVIEASDQSGSLITAACALEQGREVMAVPGNVLSGRNRGGHALIRDGAKIVENAVDILEELEGTLLPGAGIQRAGRASVDPLLALMEAGQPYDLDGLAGLSGLNGARLLPRLLNLELAGLVRRLEGGRFMRPI